MEIERDVNSIPRDTKAAAGHLRAVLSQRLEELAEAKAKVDACYTQYTEGAITGAELQMWVLALALAVNAVALAGQELDFVESARRFGW